MTEIEQFHGSQHELDHESEHKIRVNLQINEYAYLEDSLNRWKAEAMRQQDDARIDGWRLGDVDYLSRVIATIESLQNKLLTGIRNQIETTLLPHEYKYLVQQLEESARRDQRQLHESRFDRRPSDDQFERVVKTIESLIKKLTKGS